MVAVSGCQCRICTMTETESWNSAPMDALLQRLVQNYAVVFQCLHRQAESAIFADSGESVDSWNRVSLRSPHAPVEPLTSFVSASLTLSRHTQLQGLRDVGRWCTRCACSCHGSFGAHHILGAVARTVLSGTEVNQYRYKFWRVVLSHSWHGHGHVCSRLHINQPQAILAKTDRIVQLQGDTKGPCTPKLSGTPWW